MFGCTSNSYWKHQPIQSCFSAHVKLPPTIRRAPAPFSFEFLISHKTNPFDTSHQKKKRSETTGDLGAT